MNRLAGRLATLGSLLASVLVACGSGGGVGSPATCKLTDVLDAELASIAPRDCGELSTAATIAELTAAKNCVLAAIESREPFVVIWDRQGTDSKVSHAYFGVLGADDRLETSSVHYDGDPGGGGGEGRPYTEISSCGALQPVAACADSALPSSLCLQCTTPVVADTCRTP